MGRVPPRGEQHGPLVEQRVMRFMTEAKVLPASVLNRKVNEKAEHIEKTEGRKPGKKERRELKDKLPSKLAMTWDDRVSFVLTEGLQIKNITLLDAVMDGNSKDDSGFDTDVAIATGELSSLLPDLIEALGGEGRTGMGDLPASLAASASTTGPKAAPADTSPGESPF